MFSDGCLSFSFRRSNPLENRSAGRIKYPIPPTLQCGMGYGRNTDPLPRPVVGLRGRGFLFSARSVKMDKATKALVKQVGMIELPSDRFEFLGMRSIEGKDGTFDLFEFKDKKQNLDFGLYEREVECEVSNGVVTRWTTTKVGLERSMRRAAQREVVETEGQKKIVEFPRVR